FYSTFYTILFEGYTATSAGTARISGLAVFSCMPTTLTSGVALTQLAGGNTALALAITVISNLFGILTVPLSISKFAFMLLVSHLILLVFNTIAVQSLSVATGGKDSVLSEKGNAHALIIIASQRSLWVSSISTNYKFQQFHDPFLLKGNAIIACVIYDFVCPVVPASCLLFSFWFSSYKRYTIS
ncbi:hypothetical protein MKX03_036412, partial [Papaver bracteatum]